MGYTMYWELGKATELPSGALKIIMPMLSQAYADGIIQLESQNDEPPVMNVDEIIFNGVGDDACETFAFNAGDDRWDFSKTNGRPYTVMVAKCLIIISHFTGCEIYCDGDWNETFADEMEWANQKLGKPAQINLKK